RPGRRSCAASVWQPSPPAAVARPTVSAPPRSRPEPTADRAAAIERRPASEALLVGGDGLVSYRALSDTPNRITYVRRHARSALSDGSPRHHIGFNAATAQACCCAM